MLVVMDAEFEYGENFFTFTTVATRDKYLEQLAAAEAAQQQMAEELSDANAKRSLLAQKIVQV
mgnify:CR=1 FL=1